MLSRIANNLYWMGRYFERAEHLARYTKEIYFSSLDAPILEAYDRRFVLESMLYMAGIFDMKNINEKDVLHKIGFDRNNPHSIISSITSGRENARGAQNIISAELWEAINKYYHKINSFSEDVFLSTGLYDFSQVIIEQSSVVRGKIRSTLLHDETWAIILLGTHIERAIQTIRIINSKLNDILKIEQSGYSVNDLSFEWTTLLRCTESFDMNRKYYGSIPCKEEVLEFLILNQLCPRSIHYSLISIKEYLSKVSKKNSLEIDSSSIEFQIGKLCAHYEYLTIDEIKDDIYSLLNFTLGQLRNISSNFEQKYLYN